MTEKQILEWCMNRGELKRRYNWYSDQHYKIAFENGDSYEWQRRDVSSHEYIVKTWINGEMVQNARYRDGWLKNGSYGAEKLEDLPLENAA